MALMRKEEPGVVTDGECLDRRIADKQTPSRNAAWEQDRNANHIKANWRPLSPTTNSRIWMFGRLSAPSAAPLRTISWIGSNSAGLGVSQPRANSITRLFDGRRTRANVRDDADRLWGMLGSPLWAALDGARGADLQLRADL